MGIKKVMEKALAMNYDLMRANYFSVDEFVKVVLAPCLMAILLS